MSAAEPHPVRPTKRCLDDLGIGFPVLYQPLHAVGHPVVVRAQQVPLEVEASGAERIASIKDRVWFKVKTGVYRAAVHRLGRSEEQPLINDAEAWWWIGASGRRKADSGTDFYAALEAECRRAGKGTGAVTSTHLLPMKIDLQRLEAELATLWTTNIRTVVCRLVAQSLQDGKTWTVLLHNHEISAVVRARDSEAYLAVGTTGILDPGLIAVILAAVPGVAPGDWLPEPEGCFGITPKPGQILYSAVILPEIQSRIVGEYGD